MTKIHHLNLSNSETVANDITATPSRQAASPLSTGIKPPIPQKRVVKRLLKLGDEDGTEHISSLKKTRCEAYYKSWKNRKGKENEIILLTEVVDRLRKRFTLHLDHFDAFVSFYAHYKSIAATEGSHPYTIPKSFYKLFQTVAKGSWESVESTLDGGVGLPPFETSKLPQILRTIHEQVATGRLYFHALVLPYEKGSIVYDLITHDMFGAEVAAVVKPELLSGWFLHELNSFRYDEERHGKEEVFSSPVYIAVWINEQYRMKYPPPFDVEDCFHEWEHNTFGPDADVVDYNSVDNCFPERNRGADIATDIFNECMFCK